MIYILIIIISVINICNYYVVSLTINLEVMSRKAEDSTAE